MKPIIFPVFRYADAPAAITWLAAAVGFEKQAAFEGPGGTVAHAELRFGGGVIAISSAGPPVDGNPWSRVRQGIYVTIDDVDAHCERARNAGARIAIEPYDASYGSREYSAWDVEGHLWGFGTYPMGSPNGEPTLFPEVGYRDVAALAWLAEAFGFRTTEQVPGPDGSIVHTEMGLGDSTIMVNPANAADAPLTQAVSVRVDDPDTAFARATAHGASVVFAPFDTHYGARACWLRDPEGFLWGFSTYLPAIRRAGPSAPAPPPRAG